MMNPSAEQANYQDLCGFGLAQAIENEKTALSALVRINSYLLDVYKGAFPFAPVHRNFLYFSAQALARLMEFQMNWFSPVPSTFAPAKDDSSNQQTDDELAYSMDIAIGERHVTVTSSSGTPARLPSEMREREMAVALGARAGR
jgi:hypothetical protein